MDSEKYYTWARRIQAIAQTGLSYTRDIYDKERYQELSLLSEEMLAQLSSRPQSSIAKLITEEIGYATPKIDVRAFILKEGQLLLVKESQDGLWSLPGGWAEVNCSPSECIIKEVKEESGFDVCVVKMLAFWDKLKHDHPPHWPHTYKCIFHCDITGGAEMANHEIIEVGFFDISDLPELSVHRVTNMQLQKLHALVMNPQETSVD